MIKTPLSTVIGGAFWTPNCTILGGASRTLNQIIKSLFANNEQGFAYDPNDLSTMWQDATGTVPVTGVGQAVGSMLDKSKGLVLGTNVISNSNFASLNGWASGSFMQAVLVQGGVQISSPASTTGGNISLSVTNHFSWSPQLSLGKRFKITFDAKHVSGTGVLQVGSSFSVGLQINQNETGGVFKRYTTEVTGSFGGFATAAAFGATNGSVWVINNVVSQEVIGNHTYQTTSSMRPLLVASPQRLDFDIAEDNLITTLPAQLTGCTVIRSVPNVGTQILTGQTIPATYKDNQDHCGLIVINRALTATETSQITKLFNKAAGV